MKLDAFAADCRTRGLDGATIKLYISRIEQFQVFIQAKGKKIIRADRLDVRDYAETLRAKGLKTKTIHLHLTALSSIYEWMIFEGKIKSNPVLEVRRRLKQYKAEGEQETHKLISVEEAARLVESLVDVRDRALVLLLLKTGIRKGEAVGLDVDSIGWADQSLTLKPTKKRSNRHVFFDDETAFYLKRWLDVRSLRRGAEGPALFLGELGERLGRSGIDEVVKKGAMRAGLHDESSDRMEAHFSPHACRHWFTTYLLRAGMNVKYVQWLRGDAIKEAVDIYFHISPEDVRKQYLAHIPQLGV